VLWLCIRLPRLLPEAGIDATGAGCARLERATLERLALWARQWSSQVSYRCASAAADDALLWIETGASQKLLGDARTLQAQIAGALTALRYSGELATAPTPQAALLLTRVPPQRRLVTTLPQLHQQLAALPLRLLALPAETLLQLHGAGLRRIGELLALPPADIARRFGPETTLYLQRLTGAAIEPLPPVPLPACYDSECEFEVAVEDATALLFPLQRLLREFAGYLLARDRAVQSFRLRFRHYRQADSELPVRLSQSCRDATQLLAVTRERLAAYALAAPVRALHLEATRFVAPVVLQNDFFAREAQQAQEFQQLLDRLQARLGAESIQRLQPCADHRPEHAWRSLAIQDAGKARAPLITSVAPRPCWLLDTPQPIDPPGELLCGAERIESGWWDGGDAARDYYLVRAADGARQWVFQNLRNGQWFLHGLWS